MKKIQILFKSLLFILLLQACGETSHEQLFDSSTLDKRSLEEVEQVVEDFILAENNQTIEIGEGFFDLKTQLILDSKENIIIKGAGMTKTVLSFRNLKTGGEGMKIVGKNITVQDLTIEDAPGDGIKVQHTDGLTLRKVHVTWTHGNKSKNGTYALYPVQCKNVLIDECIAAHSRDAGIYVGQSENIIVKNSLAYGNVAGIEIENCDNAEVFGNTARNNSGGILVFNLPGLPKSDGRGTKIYNNQIIENNHKNFATPMGEGPNGNTVTMIPPGSGVVLLAAKEVEIFDNEILRNKTVGVAVASYQITGFPTDAPNWSPYTSEVYIHDNTYDRSKGMPDLTRELGQLISLYNAHGKAKTQDIVYDGIVDKSRGTNIIDNPMNICISEPKIQDLLFTRFDLSQGEDNIQSYPEVAPFTNCNVRIETDVTGIASR
ncbi:MAG: right-handed parallel beta-helix repeat-containing protein [Algoriphagus sp.]|uniref:parallel beta-helix domain-containing protein n=1 Tax=Algoriphagus sp. TaxID=1872435 RepID=UPI0017D98F7B|nr:parallel beta-helix domain-containing protein [Algoriphagus sp.]NVJ86255.1 right-handed parallel beta-helix repeat-containing protein [Algoriphagus sp.]